VLLSALAFSVQGTWAQRPDVTEAPGPLSPARDAIRHGRYAEAESLLTPLASRANPNEAALELGLLLRQLGRRAEARGWLESVVGSTRDSSVAALVRVGRAAHALGEFRIANEAFQDAAARDPEDVSLNLAWGRLFLDAHNRAEAAKSFQMAIDADEDSAAARLGLAEALAEDTPPAAMKAAEIALDLDASLVPAHLLVAGLLLDRDERAEAVAAIDRALEINPSSLDALALRGAIAYLEGRLDDFGREVAAIDVINPSFGDAFRVAGDLAARNYRFDEAVELTRRAIEREPDNTRAHADLGMHLLRTGDEPGARVALEAAFEVDPFDQITFNLLSMMDRLDTFQTIEEDPFVVRFHPDELPVLREYALPLAHRALAEMTARYGFTPEAPILIEIFPQHDDFAVRNLGLPGMIGALGACFGRVVTMDSPTAREPGTFSWEETLWHELGHVITLQMSNNRVPRWLSEGASVYEERRASDEWGREFEVPFAQAMLEDKILSLEDLNAGFTDPQLISLAYYEASLLVEHIVDTYGQAGLSALLRAYGEGLEDEEALRQSLGAEMDELQEAFDASLERKFQPVVAALSPVRGLQAAAEDAERAAELARDNPENYLAQLTYGRLLQSEGRLDEAMAVLEKAAALVPMASGRGSPRLLLAQIAMEQKNPARASAELEALLEHDHTNVEAARELVRLLAVAPTPERARLIAAYKRIVAIDPFDPAAHARLGRLLLDEGQDTDRAIRELRAALAAGPVDRAEVHVDLAEAYLASRQPAQARRQTLAALEIAPAYERAQDLLLKIVGP
jgi:tetratricopeptide (TPR) repeat protein